MDALKFEDKIQMLEARVNMALEIGTMSLERIDELRNKIKFAIDQEIKSEDDMDVEDGEVNVLDTISRTYNEWFNGKIRSVNEIDNIGEFLFIFVRLMKSQMGSALKIDQDVRKTLNRFFDCDGALRIKDEKSVKDILNIVENTLKMKINRDFSSEVKDGSIQEHRDSICGRRASGECKARSRSESPGHYSTRRREDSDERRIPSPTKGQGDEALLLGEQ